GVSAGGGDRDVSWAFRDLTTLIRRQPKIQGYVYTELTDIEWEHNGFANYDRTPKAFGYDAFVPDMRPNELNGADFIGSGGPPARVVRPGGAVTVPVFVSHFSDRAYRPAVRWWVDGWTDEADSLMVVTPRSRPASWKAYDVEELEPVTFTAPDRPFVGSVNLTLRDPNNQRIAANYVNLVVRPEKPLPRVERRGAREGVRPRSRRPPALVGRGGQPRGEGLRPRPGLLRIPAESPRGRGQGPARPVLPPARGRVEGGPREGRLALAGQPAGLPAD